MKFHSKTLQASFDEAQSVFEQIKPLDPLAEDIRELEFFLKDLKLKESFVYNLKLASTPIYEEELLVWNHKTERLLYIKNSYPVSCRSHDKGYYPQVDYNNKETVIEQPLIDAPRELQRAIAQEDKLALFLSFLSQKIHLKNNQKDYLFI